MIKTGVKILAVLILASCGKIEDRLHLRPKRFRCNENVFCYCILNNGKQQPVYCTNGVHMDGVPTVN